MVADLRDIQTNRASTADLIRLEGQLITLLRPRQALPDGAGGFLRPSSTLTPQTPVNRFFSLVNQQPNLSYNNQGEEWLERFVLIGMYNDDIREYDRFNVNNREFQVTVIHVDRSYQVKAEGVCYSDGS